MTKLYKKFCANISLDTNLLQNSFPANTVYLHAHKNCHTNTVAKQPSVIG